ncbi:hypothetical protein BpHYR1_048661 [Brachionus plicatilis]|uniref:Uncharacterized protein n=1 Tax=Brachionus plicatilis TaxID=10195 RepID=A0A3M7PZZ7_BRAPC|nr:hypothetical protein BpHYR1_048661 [Brachionus plicatilis]
MTFLLTIKIKFKSKNIYYLSTKLKRLKIFLTRPESGNAKKLQFSHPLHVEKHSFFFLVHLTASLDLMLK